MVEIQHDEYDPDTPDDESALKRVKRVLTRHVIEGFPSNEPKLPPEVNPTGPTQSNGPLTGNGIPGGELLKETDMLATATLGVGLVNMGIGMYNAYKANEIADRVEETAAATTAGLEANRAAINQVGREVGEVKKVLVAGLSSVKNMLEYQNGILHGIQQRQELHGEKLDTIMAGLLEGFDSMEQLIESVTDTRRQDEYLERLNGLHMAKREAAEALEFEGSLSPLELEKLSNRAENFQIWLEARLQSPDLHLLARQPIVLALVEAKMTRIDALMFQDSDKYSRRAHHRIDEIRSSIQKEARELHSQATPWEVVTAIRDQVANYATLNRALERAQELLGEERWENGLRVAPWNDSLPNGPLRQSKNGIGEPLELKTIDDYEWFIRAFDLERESFDIHTVTQVSPEKLARRLGASELSTSTEAVRPYLLPETWQQYREDVRSEFEFDPGTQLIAVDVQDLVNKESASPGSKDTDVPEWNFRGHYVEVQTLFLRQGRNQTYRFDLPWPGRLKLRFHVDVQEADVRVAVVAINKDGQTFGPHFAYSGLDRGKVQFRLNPPNTGGETEFELRSKQDSIWVDGTAHKFRYLCERSEKI